MWDERDYRTALEFTDGEVASFVAGVEAGEFDPTVLAPGGKGPGRPPESTLAASGGTSGPAPHPDSAKPSTAI
jgi:hypothetical protein